MGASLVEAMTSIIKMFAMPLLLYIFITVLTKGKYIKHNHIMIPTQLQE